MNGKKLLLALTLAGSALMGGSVAAQESIAGCSGCGDVQPVRLAQRGPISAGPVVAVPPRDWNHEMPRNPVSCCDPVLASFANPAMINQIFKYDLDPSGNLASNYGIIFQPNAAFKNAVNNSAFIANVMMGLPYSHFIIRTQMRTDNLPNQAWPTAGKAHLYENMWNSGNNLLANHNLYVEDSPPALLGSPPAQPHNRPSMAPAHMKANGVRYVAKLTYWVAYTDPATGQWMARQITCSNVPSIYVGANINTAMNKIGAGGGTTPQLEVEIGKPGANQNSLSAPVQLTPDEVKAMGLKRNSDLGGIRPIRD
jgi:hypothetical protein